MTISQTEALATVERMAQQRAMTAHAMGHSDTERHWLDVLAVVERAKAREWPTLNDVPAGVDRVRDPEGNVWVLTGGDGCGHSTCAAGLPVDGPFTEEEH
ncbi:hypothetical protein E3_0320 [Rhodococcus phage E3]|uniref:hypothetical protein n=1 Tax=Rhodococcus phage E3 TaxID=1007869 RepID=UPI0002C6AF6F|nr:hypothetical protein M176_gp033 [Rhodococcus phage E3]AEQ20943.1 hypothetical protein E3_0320 [Rhodococcus phage E3]